MSARTNIHGLQVATELYRFIEDQVLPGTGIASAAFWAGFDQIVADLAPKNAALLAERDRIQAAMDSWHRANPGPITDMAAYQGWLRKIGYLVDAPADVQATTANVDAELALQAGPQLVVPIMNARYALNAANARWGSLYDALYGTDAISEAPRSSPLPASSWTTLLRWSAPATARPPATRWKPASWSSSSPAAWSPA